MAAQMPQEARARDIEDRQVEQQRQDFDQQQREQQRQAERQQQEAAAFQKKAQNSATEKVFRSMGVKNYTDAFGDIQPVTTEDGKVKFEPSAGPKEIDPQTGRAFRTVRDETGATKQEWLDTNADIGPGEDPNDGLIYRKNKHSPWEPIKPEEGIAAAEEPVRKASAAALKAKALAEKEREISLLGIAESEASAKGGRPSPTELRTASFDVQSADPAIKAAGQAILDQEKAYVERSTKLAQLKREHLDLKSKSNDAFVQEWQASNPQYAAKLQENAKQNAAAIDAERQKLEADAAAFKQRAAAGFTDDERPQAMQEQAQLLQREDALNQKATEHNSQATNLANWQKKQAEDNAWKSLDSMWSNDAPAPAPAVKGRSVKQANVNPFIGNDGKPGYEAGSVKEAGEFLAHPDGATARIYLKAPGAKTAVGQQEKNNGAAFADKVVSELQSISDEQAKAFTEGEGAFLAKSGAPEAMIEERFQAHMTKTIQRQAERRKAVSTQVRDLYNEVRNGRAPVNALVDAYAAMGKDARIAPDVNEVLDAAGDARAQDLGVQKKRMEALEKYKAEYAGTPLYDLDGSVSIAETKQQMQLLKEQRNKDSNWFENAQMTIGGWEVSALNHLRAMRAGVNFIFGDTDEAVELAKTVEEYNKGLAVLDSNSSAWDIPDQYRDTLRTWRDWSQFVSKSAVEALPSVAVMMASGGAGALAGRFVGGSRAFMGVGIRAAAAEVAVAQDITAQAAATVVRSGLIAEAQVGGAVQSLGMRGAVARMASTEGISSRAAERVVRAELAKEAQGAMTQLVRSKALEIGEKWGMRIGAFAGTYEQQAGEYVNGALARFDVDAMKNDPDTVRKAVAAAMVAAVPAAIIDVLDGNEMGALKAALGESPDVVKKGFLRGLASAGKEFGMSVAKEGATGFVQSVLGVLVNRYAEGKDMELPFTSDEVKEVIDGSLAEAVGGGVIEATTASIGRVRHAVKSWTAGRALTVAKQAADDALKGATWQSPQLKRVQDAVSQAETVYDEAVKTGDRETALAVRQFMVDMVRSIPGLAAESSAIAQEANDQLTAAGPQAATMGNALLAVAGGMDLATLPDADIAALGYERQPDGGVKPAKDAVPLVTKAPGGTWVITDAALGQLEAVSPAARSMVADDERTVRIKDAARTLAQNVPAATEQAAVEPELPDVAQPARWGVTVKKPGGQEEVIQVEAADAKAAEAQVTGMDLKGGMVTGVEQIAKAPAASQTFDLKTEVARAAQGHPKAAEIAEAAARTLQALGGAFSGVTPAAANGSGGFALLKDGKLAFSADDFKGLVKRISDGDIVGWVEKAILEEAIHAAAIRLEADGKINGAAIWNSLPAKLQKLVLDSYDSEETNAFALGHEFLRMVVQGRVRIEGGKLVSGDGKLSEEMAPSKMKALWNALKALRQYLTDLVKSLRADGAPESLVAAVEEQAAMIEQLLKELTSPGVSNTETTQDSSARSERETHNLKADGSNPSPATSGKLNKEQRRRLGQRTLEELAKITNGHIPQAAIESIIEGTFNGDFRGAGTATLEIDEDGNVVLRRFASDSSHMVKEGQRSSGPDDLWQTSESHGGGNGVPTIGTARNVSGVPQNSYANYTYEGVIKIPVSEFLKEAKAGNIILGNIGESEIVVSPSVAQKYLSEMIERATGKKSPAPGATGSGDNAGVATPPAGSSTGVGSSIPQSDTNPANVKAAGNESVLVVNGEQVRVRYVVQEAGDARPSHDAQGNPTPGYDQSLQPRDRSQKEYQMQARNIAKGLDFAQAAYFPGTTTPATTAEYGPPVMTATGDTLIGNGREIGTVLAYKNGQASAERYKEALIASAAQFGLDPAAVRAMKAPILKRQIIDTLPVETLRKISQESNAGVAMDSNAVEIAGQDASRLTPEILALIDPNGELDAAVNRPFVRRFVRDVMRGEGANEANATPSELRQRMELAVFTAAYGLEREGRAALARMMGDATDDTRRITKALMQYAPGIAAMKAAIAIGDLHPRDISSEIGRAVQRIAVELREQKKASDAWQALSGAQGELMLDGEDAVLERDILSFLVSSRRDSGTIAEALSNYVESVYALGNPKQADMFGNEPASREQLWRKAVNDISGEPAVPEPVVDVVSPAAEPIREQIKEAKKKPKKARKKAKQEVVDLIAAAPIPLEDVQVLEQEAEAIAPEGSAGRIKTMEAFEGLYSSRLGIPTRSELESRPVVQHVVRDGEVVEETAVMDDDTLKERVQSQKRMLAVYRKLIDCLSA